MQKRIARIITNKPKRTPSLDLFNELQWLSFTDRCKYHSTVMIYKIVNKAAPSYMSDIISFSQNNVYKLRSIETNDLVLQYRHKTNDMKTSLINYSRNIWNSIPLEMRKLMIFEPSRKASSNI